MVDKIGPRPEALPMSPAVSEADFYHLFKDRYRIGWYSDRRMKAAGRPSHENFRPLHKAST